jgi:hypothetical protein
MTESVAPEAGPTDVEPLVETLASAAADVEAVEDDIADVGESRVRAVADAYDRATDLLDRYEETATGSGRETFKNYLEFQDRFLELVEGLDDDVPARDAFEAANERLDKRRLNDADFEAAREILAPAADRAELLARREQARQRYRDARRDVLERVDALDERIESLERLERLAEADLDAPVEELRDPVSAYNDAVTEAFQTFRRESSARAVLSFVRATRAYPLVEYRRPPADLVRYVEQNPAGENPIPTLLEYADYSNSKLSHYVDDPGTLKSRVAVDRTYLERLGPGPLTVSWPPPSATELRYRVDELISLVARFAPESVVARLRTVRDLTLDEPRYERLRRSAVAREQLTPAERERVASGRVADELADARAARNRLAEALDAHPRL